MNHRKRKKKKNCCEVRESAAHSESFSDRFLCPMSSAEVFDSSVDPPAAKKRKLPTTISSTSTATATMANNNGSTSRETPSEIDEGLYSRQLYVLGHDAMRRMANSDILISGIGGLGVEIAKNVILGGVKSVTLHDQATCTIGDLSAQYYLSDSDVGKNRAEASHKLLSELNNYVPTRIYTGDLTDAFIKQFRVVVLTDTPNAEQDRIAAITHENNIALIIGNTRGLFAQIFCDFGDNFTVYDENGAQPISIMVAGITKDLDGIVTCLDETRHGLEDGQYVTFSEVITFLYDFVFVLFFCSPETEFRRSHGVCVCVSLFVERKNPIVRYICVGV